MVGDRHCRHLQCLGALDEIIHTAGPIQQRVIGVDMQVDEGISHEARDKTSGDRQQGKTAAQPNPSGVTSRAQS